ncbi:hypothetical protein [Sporomusa sp.]|nr:hypothetical protein [Sporomusa sp.]HWR44859.1 hypothetical protein [Sporomusa sp.]
MEERITENIKVRATKEVDKAVAELLGQTSPASDDLNFAENKQDPDGHAK